jgi:hypothetical protein
VATEETKQLVEPGSRVTVHGKRTQSTGIFAGVGITEDGKARVIIRVPNSPIPFAYDFDEVDRIEPAQ